MTRPARPETTQLTALLEQVETLLSALRDEAIPAVMGELERLKATLWARWFQRPAAPGDAPGDDLLVGVADAARLLGISRTAVRRLELAGTLPGVRIGRRLLFRREVLTRFAEDHERIRRVSP